MSDAVTTVVLAFMGAILTGLVWGLRLEGKHNQTARDLDRLEADHKELAQKHDSLDQRIMEKFSDVVQALARIEERLKSKQERPGPK